MHLFGCKVVKPADTINLQPFTALTFIHAMLNKEGCFYIF